MKRQVYLSLVFMFALGANPAWSQPAQAPDSPLVRAFGDQKFWLVVENKTYVIEGTKDKIVVPRGFVTDFASIPQAFWSMGLSPYGQYGRAAVVHDFLYWTQTCSRAQADRLLLIAMKESSVRGIDESLIYEGVNMGGESSWKANAAERNAGLPRVVPETYLRPADPNVDWRTYRQTLVQQGVKDPAFEQNPAHCAYGTSTNIP